MPIRKLKEPMRSAWPSAGGGPLRVLIDLPADLRQVEAGRWEGPTLPVAEHLLWSICLGSPDIELYWLGQPNETGLGAVHLQQPDLGSDHLPYQVTKAEGARWMGAIWPYHQLVRAANEDPARSLATYSKAALSHELRAHVTVTNDPDLVNLTGFYTRHCNPMNPVDALAAISLYLRKDDPFLAGWGPRLGYSFGHHLLAWVAVRTQIPSGWAWGSALVSHSSATDDDYAVLLFGSFFERLVRMLKHRDRIHRATLQTADNKTGLEATEALDTMVFNIVGAFDAAAIAAHMGAGLPPGTRRSAGWQSKEWRKQLGVPRLYEMFHKKRPAEDLFTICRLLRNTVHGAGLSSTVSSSGISKDTLVRLPQAEAGDIVERLNRLAAADIWGVDARLRDRTFVDPARLVEGLIPLVFATLEEVLEHTPLDHLAGTSTHRQGPPAHAPFDLNTRTRASLLYGLEPPTL